MKIVKSTRTLDKKSGCNSSSSCTDNYEEARKHIQEAINCLGVIASDDEIAKDSIANLGVVALDLSSSSSCNK